MVNYIIKTIKEEILEKKGKFNIPARRLTSKKITGKKDYWRLVFNIYNDSGKIIDWCYNYRQLSSIFKKDCYRTISKIIVKVDHIAMECKEYNHDVKKYNYNYKVLLNKPDMHSHTEELYTYKV